MTGPRVTWSKSSPGSQTRTSSCQGEAPFGAVPSRSAFAPAVAPFDTGGAVSRRVFTHRGSRPSRGGASHRFRPDREIRAQDLAPVREHGFELCRNRSLVRARVAGGREVPPQHRGCESAKVRQPGLGLRRAFGRIASPVLQAPTEKLLAFGVSPIQQRPRLDERRGGDDQPGWADEADPFQVGGDLGVESGHGLRGG